MDLARRMFSADWFRGSRITVLAAAILVITGLAFAACGDDEEGSDGGTNTEASAQPSYPEVSREMGRVLSSQSRRRWQRSSESYTTLRSL